MSKSMRTILVEGLTRASMYDELYRQTPKLGMDLFVRCLILNRLLDVEFRIRDELQ